MQSENIIGFRHFPFNLYADPLSKRYRSFLGNSNYSGKDKHAIPNELESKLEQSMRIVYHIMHDFDRLDRTKVYDVINAKSMQHFLDASIKYYDFRTSELVRLLFETAILFLKKSDEFENQKEVIEDMSKPLSKFFQMLSHSLLQKEDLEKTLDKKEQEHIKKYLQRHDGKIDFDEYTRLKKRNEELYQELIEEDIHKRIIGPKIKIKDVFDPMIRTIFHTTEEIIDEIRKNKERITELHGESAIREGQIWRLSNIYNHLEPQICKIKPLEEFQYMLGRSELDHRYNPELGKELEHVETKREFDDIIYEKYKNKTYGKKVKCLIMPGKDKQGAAKIPLSIYKKEMKKFFEEKGVELDYDKAEARERKAEESVKNWKYLPRWILNDIR